MSGVAVESLNNRNFTHHYNEQMPLSLLDPIFYAQTTYNFYATKIEPNNTYKTITLLFVGTVAGVFLISSAQSAPFYSNGTQMVLESYSL